MYFVADFGLAGQIHRRSGDGMPSPGGSTDGFPPIGHRRRPSKAHTDVIMTNVRGNPQASFWVNRRDRHEWSRCRTSGRFDPAQSPYMRRVRRGGADPAAHRLPAARVLTAARHPLATRHGDWNHYRGRPRRATNRGDRPGQTPAARRGWRARIVSFSQPAQLRWTGAGTPSAGGRAHAHGRRAGIRGASPVRALPRGAIRPLKGEMVSRESGCALNGRPSRSVPRAMA